MIEGIRTIIYPVKDIAQARTLYSKLLGVRGSDWKIRNSAIIVNPQS